MVNQSWQSVDENHCRALSYVTLLLSLPTTNVNFIMTIYRKPFGCRQQHRPYIQHVKHSTADGLPVCETAKSVLPECLPYWVVQKSLVTLFFPYVIIIIMLTMSRTKQHKQHILIQTQTFSLMNTHAEKKCSNFKIKKPVTAIHKLIILGYNKKQNDLTIGY